jgi:signal transduction histidine kinase/ActR/RegA family two-component response regulator
MTLSSSRSLPLLRSLRSQYLLVSLVTFAAMLGLLLWNAQHLMQQALDDRFEDERQAYAPLLVAALGPLLAARDYATLADLLEQTARSRNLSFVEVADSRGAPVARAGGDDHAEHRVAELPVQLAGQTLGQVRFGIRTEALAVARERLWRNSLAIGTGVLAAGGLLLALAMGWLSRGFGALSQASRRIAGGDYDARLAPSRLRELDQVATAFNHMAQAIQTQLGELRDQQQFLRGVLDTLSEGFMIIDRDDRVLDCNETFLRLHAMPRPDHAAFDPGRHGVRLLRADGSEVPGAELSTRVVLATGMAQRDRVLCIRRADGSTCWVSVNASPLWRAGSSEPYAALTTLTDITRHVEAEQLLRRANDTLEQRVRERTAELERAKDEAEQASRAKSEFLSRMSHELRTPLNAILGFAQLLAMERERLNDADRQKLQHIESAGWHLLALINEVLDLARIEAGAMTTSTEPVELGALIAETLPLLQAQATRQQVTLLPPPAETGGAWVLADRTRLKQVLANLLSNAVKYNRAGGSVTLTLSAPDAGRRVLAVRDTGRGLEPGQVQQLYQPFVRFVRDDEVMEGTGIGLVITRRMVELMGGRLEVESMPGQGSVFSVALPAVDRPVAAATPLPAATAPPPAPVGSALRLLYVEDNPSNIELLQQLMTLRPGWELAVATDGPTGLSRLQDGGFDAALIDIDLPGYDGIELCRRLKADEATRGIPLLALSAKVMPADVRRALAAGFDDHLGKPIDVAALLARLDRLPVARRSVATDSGGLG